MHSRLPAAAHALPCAAPATSATAAALASIAFVRAAAFVHAVAATAILILRLSRLPSPIPGTANSKLPVPTDATATAAATTRLVPIPPTPSPHQRRLLVALRRDCGWGEDQIDQWLHDAARGRRVNFFIVRDSFAAVPDDSSHTSVIGNKIFNQQCLGWKNFNNIDLVINTGMVALILDHPTGDIHLASHLYSTAMVCSLCVFKQWHNNGHGTLAMALIEQVAKLHGARTVTLETMGDRLIRLYYRLGYREFRPRCEKEWGTDVASFCKD
ncbi:hypothetical protein HDU83_003561, partial [Entophlyctis luteolus]